MKSLISLLIAVFLFCAGCTTVAEKSFYDQQMLSLKAKHEIDAAKVDAETARYRAIEAIAGKADVSTLAVLAAGLTSEGAVRAALSGSYANSSAGVAFQQAPESLFDKSLRTLSVIANVARDVVVPVRLAQYARDAIIRQSDNAVASEQVRTNGYVAINGQTANLGAAIANRPNPAANISTTNTTNNTSTNTASGNSVIGSGTSTGPVTNTTTTTTTTTRNCNGGTTGGAGNGAPGGPATTTTGNPTAGAGAPGGASGSANGGNCP